MSELNVTSGQRGDASPAFHLFFTESLGGRAYCFAAEAFSDGTRTCTTAKISRYNNLFKAGSRDITDKCKISKSRDKKLQSADRSF